MNVEIITAPEYKGRKYISSLFLAGGITNCPEWQTEVIERLKREKDLRITIFNPRRPSFDVTDPLATIEQITWEHHKLREASEVLFWFPAETLCPIVLFELGSRLEAYDAEMWHIPLFIGCHPGYARVKDVEIQTRLVRLEQRIYTSLEELIAEVIVYYRFKHLIRKGEPLELEL